MGSGIVRGWWWRLRKPRPQRGGTRRGSSNSRHSECEISLSNSSETRASEKTNQPTTLAAFAQRGARNHTAPPYLPFFATRTGAGALRTPLRACTWNPARPHPRVAHRAVVPTCMLDCRTGRCAACAGGHASPCLYARWCGPSWNEGGAVGWVGLQLDPSLTAPPCVHSIDPHSILLPPPSLRLQDQPDCRHSHSCLMSLFSRKPKHGLGGNALCWLGEPYRGGCVRRQGQGQG